MLRTRIGSRCHFTHPETKEVIEGTYQRGRKVAVMTRMTRHEVKPDGGRSFEIEETVYKVPPHIPITFGAAPKGKTS